MYPSPMYLYIYVSVSNSFIYLINLKGCFNCSPLFYSSELLSFRRQILVFWDRNVFPCLWSKMAINQLPMYKNVHIYELPYVQKGVLWSIQYWYSTNYWAILHVQICLEFFCTIIGASVNPEICFPFCYRIPLKTIRVEYK